MADGGVGVLRAFLRVFLDASPQAAQRHETGDGHDHGHDVEDVVGGRREVGADERRDRGRVAVSALQLGDLRRLG
jgi:hypothetical protein